MDDGRHEKDDGRHEKHFSGSGHDTIAVGDLNAVVTLRGHDNVITGGSGDVFVIGGDSSGGDTITLGDGDDRVLLHGNDHTITLGGGADDLALFGNHSTATLGDGRDRALVHGNDDTITLGNGNDALGLDGDGNTLALGSGSNTVFLSPHSSFNTISVGGGTDTIITSAHDHDNTFSLDASNTSLLLHGQDNLVFINGGTDSISDSHFPPGTGDDLVLNIGSAGGNVDISHFSAALGTVDLVASLGFATGALAAAGVTSDGHGGSMLAFTAGLGSIDFIGVAPTLLTAANFNVT